MILTEELFAEILGQFELDPDGDHGVAHWGRVFDNGRAIARVTGTNQDVCALFSVFHDAKRTSEGRDPGHGLRGAEYMKQLRGRLFDLPDRLFDLAYKACKFHSYPIKVTNSVIQSCWDADRLDIGRFGAEPNSQFLSDRVASQRQLCETAFLNGRRGVVPSVVSDWISSDVSKTG